MAKIVRESRSSDTVRFNKFVTSSLVSGILSFVLGLLIFILSEQIGILIGYVAGVLFLYNGFIAIYKFLKRDGAKLYSLNIIWGVIACILGVVIIFAPTSVTSFINVCFGIFLIVSGANKISYGAWFKMGNDKAWLITIVTGVILIALGILIINNPFETTITMNQLVGIFLMLSSALDISNAMMLKKRSDEIVKIFW